MIVSWSLGCIVRFLIKGEEPQIDVPMARYLVVGLPRSESPTEVEK